MFSRDMFKVEIMRMNFRVGVIKFFNFIYFFSLRKVSGKIEFE